MTQDRGAALNPLPWGVWLLVLAIASIEMVLWAGAHGLVNWAGSAGWRAQALVAVGISPQIQHWMVETGQTPLPHLARYLGYGLVHLGPAQAALVVVITAALGKYCAERLGSARLILLLILAQAMGGAVFGALADPGAWLIGGYPIIFALAGSYGWYAWHSADSLRSRAQALGLVVVLVTGRLALAVIARGGLDWLADITALLAGAALTPLLRPGLRARLRRP